MNYTIIHAERELRYHEELKNLLALHREFEFIDHCCYLDSAIKSLRRYQPAILITGSKLYDETRVVESFCDYRDACMRDLKIIVLTGKDNPEHFLNSVVKGVDGYIHKTCGIDEIYQCIYTVANGDNYLGVQKQVLKSK